MYLFYACMGFKFWPIGLLRSPKATFLLRILKKYILRNLFSIIHNSHTLGLKKRLYYSLYSTVRMDGYYKLILHLYIALIGQELQICTSCPIRT